MVFKPQRKNLAVPLVLLTSAFIVFNAAVFLFSGAGAGLVMTSISLPVLLLIIFETGKFGWLYEVDEKGITVKRTFKKYLIPSGNIGQVTEIGIIQAEKILEKTKADSPGSGDNMNPGLSRQIAVGRLIGFSSVTTYASGSGKRTGRRVKNKNSPSNDNFILLTKKDGNRYILTPADTKGFLEAYKKK